VGPPCLLKSPGKGVKAISPRQRWLLARSIVQLLLKRACRESLRYFLHSFHISDHCRMVDSRVVAGHCSSLLDLALIGSSLLCQGCRSPCRKTLRPSSQRLASWLGKTKLSTRPWKCAASFLLLPSKSSRTSKGSRRAKSAHDTSPKRQVECLYPSLSKVFVKSLCQKSLSIDSLFGSRFGAGPGRA